MEIKIHRGPVRAAHEEDRATRRGWEEENRTDTGMMRIAEALFADAKSNIPVDATVLPYGADCTFNLAIFSVTGLGADPTPIKIVGRNPNGHTPGSFSRRLPAQWPLLPLLPRALIPLASLRDQGNNERDRAGKR